MWRVSEHGRLGISRLRLEMTGEGFAAATRVRASAFSSCRQATYVIPARGARFGERAAGLQIERNTA